MKPGFETILAIVQFSKIVLGAGITLFGQRSKKLQGTRVVLLSSLLHGSESILNTCLFLRVRDLRRGHFGFQFLKIVRSPGIILIGKRSKQAPDRR